MPDMLPVPLDAPTAVVTALAKAAAEVAVEEVLRRQGAPALAPAAVEEVCRKCLRDAFLRFNVNLDDPKSVEEFCETLAHARRAKAWWAKAGGTVLTGVVTAVVGLVLAAVGSYVARGMK